MTTEEAQELAQRLAGERDCTACGDDGYTLDAPRCPVCRGKEKLCSRGEPLEPDEREALRVAVQGFVQRWVEERQLHDVRECLGARFVRLEEVKLDADELETLYAWVRAWRATRGYAASDERVYVPLARELGIHRRDAKRLVEAVGSCPTT